MMRKNKKKITKSITKTVNVYECTFKRKDGSPRFIRFVTPGELPRNLYVKSTKLMQSRRKANTVDGLNLVWDIDAKGWRYVNTKELLTDIRFKPESVEEVFKDL